MTFIEWVANWFCMRLKLAKLCVDWKMFAVQNVNFLLSSWVTVCACTLINYLVWLCVSFTHVSMSGSFFFPPVGDWYSRSVGNRGVWLQFVLGDADYSQLTHDGEVTLKTYTVSLCLYASRPSSPSRHNTQINIHISMLPKRKKTNLKPKQVHSGLRASLPRPTNKLCRSQFCLGPEKDCYSKAAAALVAVKSRATQGLKMEQKGEKMWQTKKQILSCWMAWGDTKKQSEQQQLRSIWRYERTQYAESSSVQHEPELGQRFSLKVACVKASIQRWILISLLHTGHGGLSVQAEAGDSLSVIRSGNLQSFRHMIAFGPVSASEAKQGQKALSQLQTSAWCKRLQSGATDTSSERAGGNARGMMVYLVAFLYLSHRSRPRLPPLLQAWASCQWEYVEALHSVTRTKRRARVETAG